MIRLVFLLRKKTSLTRETFQAYWKTHHAPLVKSVSSELGLLRYVQTHTIDDAESAQKARGKMETTYDGVAELWWDDESKLEETLKSEAGQRAGKLLLDDEKEFIDLENSPIWFAYEYPQINPTPENVIAEAGSSIKKVFFPLRHKSYLDEAEARKYWLTHHGPIVRAHGHEAGILCYRQVHRANSVIDASLQKARGTKANSYLGHAEAWIDQNRVRSPKLAEQANQKFIEDEMNFIDMHRSTLFFGAEYSIVDNR